ncbi:MAG: hypothetical protein PHS16_00870 [Candidatus Colwellbacteria bacterium]|jgi:predicted lipoprotein with Yx(FWY)xxD motif|nr:hypothetical protein [Candidatus Colwellbacteria bacterium]MCK9497474.1 hypothetical protein [Candidatus Colwellbacteria bacterium]MDD3752480.1 hypothetical protein [Candidatus Colwellbacteria bacterium]MDD4818730.1 hypothetical protein [Candidatus Colwellbacteria bacterium]
MNIKKFSIVAGILIIILISGYIAYTNLYTPQTTEQPEQGQPEEESSSQQALNTEGEPVDETQVPLEELDLTTVEIPEQSDANIRVFQHSELGAILVNINGMTLYTFDNDGNMQSNCYDACAESWPPELFNGSSLSIGSYIAKGTVDVFARNDGSEQITYKGMPLYTWANDQAPGDAGGESVSGWNIARP